MRTYNERLNDLATEFAKASFEDDNAGWDNRSEKFKKSASIAYIPCARIAMKHMAEAYKSGYKIGWSKRDNQQELTEYGIEQHLISLGYKPQTETI